MEITNFGKSPSPEITPVNADEGSSGDEKTRLMSHGLHTQGQLEASSTRYATVKHLARYIPELNPQHERARTMRIKMAKRTAMLRAQIAIASFVIALNLAVTIWSVLDYPPNDRGIGTFYTGDCSTTSALNSAVHVVLNLLSTLFLGAGNYCMQIQAAPSREEMDAAHAKGKALEIGVPSIKNLLRISRWRVASWIAIGLIATTLHVFWNSAIFTSLPTVFIPRAVVTSDYWNAPDNWTVTDPMARIARDPPEWLRDRDPRNGRIVPLNSSMIYAMQAPFEHYTNISTRACIETFIKPEAATRSLVVVAKNVTMAQNDGSSLIYGAMSGWDADSSWASSWICQAEQPSHEVGWSYCRWSWAQDFADDWELAEPPIQVSHCMVGEEGNNQSRCGLHYSTHVMGIVCGCTLAMLFLIIGIWFQQRRFARSEDEDRAKRPMIMVGDAIHSYLEDRQTRTYETAAAPGPYEVKTDVWRPTNVSWFKAVGTGAWVRAITLFAGAAAAFSYLVGSSAESARKIGIDISPAVLWDNGFGVDPALTAGSLGPLDSLGLSRTALMLWHVLVANLPQVVISLLYIFYNSIFTRQLVADEWVRFLDDDGKKVLRVSSPEGMQRSSYFLSLPMKYSVPLMLLSALLHWLISQSIYVVQTRAFAPGPDGERLPHFDNTGRGYSILGSVMALLLGGLMVLVMVVNSGLRRFRDVPEGFQLMGYNSSAIQAMCQGTNADADAMYFPVKIGVTTDPAEGPEPGSSRLAFSTDVHIRRPNPEESFLQPVAVKTDTRWRRFFRKE